MQFSKLIEIEDFSSEELTPYLQTIAEEEMAFFGIEKPVIIPDSKNWETAMALYSFEKHNLLKQSKLFAGIGAGTERLTEFLANKGAIVFPIDRYLERTAWSDVAPSGYMVNVSDYSYKNTHTQNIIPVHSDARVLDLPSNFFDGVYSSGSIEHFGGLDAVNAAAAEIARILKPGGIASISTEFRLSGPEHLSWFDDNCILFTTDLIEKHIVQASGLTPIGMPNNRPSSKTFETRRVLIDFLNSAKNIRTFQDKVDIYPNLVLFHEGFLFCSVHILLKKPLDWEPTPTATSKVGSFRKEVQSNNRNAIERLKRAFSDQAPISLMASNSDQSQVMQVAENKPVQRNWFYNGLIKMDSMSRKMPLLRRYLLRLLLLFPKLETRLRRKLRGF